MKSKRNSNPNINKFYAARNRLRPPKTPKALDLSSYADIGAKLERAIKKSITNPDTRTRANVKPTKPEQNMARILDEHNFKYVREYKVLSVFYDFWLPDYNLLIEIDGRYWHGAPEHYDPNSQFNVKQRLQDSFKNVVAEVQGYKLIRFFENDVTSENVMEKLRSMIAPE